MHTDAASTKGYAAILGSTWFASEWLEPFKQFHITVLELFPIVLALEMWGSQFQNHKILFLTDNEAVVAIINKTSSKDKTIMKLVRRLVISCLQNNIFFKAKHVPGKFNVLADRLSRLEFQEVLTLAPWLNKTPVQIPANLLHI